MGAAASAIDPGVHDLQHLHLPTHAGTKQHYSKKIAGVVAKEFNALRDKGLSEEELQNEILHILLKNETHILEKPAGIITPSVVEDKRLLKKKKSARRRSFDHLIFNEEVKDLDTTPVEKMFHRQLSLDSSGHVASTEPLDLDAMFRQKCVDSVKNIATKKSLTHMCAVDGSSGGHIAFQNMACLRRRLDHVCLFHAYSKESDAEELETQFQPDAVRSRYEGELISVMKLPTTKFTFYWEEKKQRDIRQVITELLSNYKGLKNPMRPTKNEPNFFYCGYTGKKGAKVDNSTLGSVTDIALRSVHMPVILCKNLCNEGSRVFVIAVDGSYRSKNGFEIALALINPKDTLQCVNVEKESEANDQKEEELSIRSQAEKVMTTAEIEEFYSGELNSYGPADNKFVKLHCPVDKSISQCLVEYSDSVNADFFAISPRTQTILTSITEYIITTVKANVILCKN